MTKPRVSVCVPVYNLEDLIAETLDSLKAQTFHDYEAIIVNDGSTDRSEQVIAPYLEDPRFRYICQENQGLAGARNTALEVAEGEWFAQLDGDDLWLPDKLELQIAMAESDRRANLIYTGVIYFRDDGFEALARPLSDMPEGDVTPEIYTDNFLVGSSVMVKTQVIRELGGYRPVDNKGEDYTLWLRLARQGIYARAVKKPLVRYRIRANSLASSRLPNFLAQIKIMGDALSREDRPHLARILRRGIARKRMQEAYERASIAAKTGEGDLRKLLWETWSCDRSDYRKLLMAIACIVPSGRRAVIRKLQNWRSVWD